eukprot:1645471-Amphidinium_carterae.1
MDKAKVCKRRAHTQELDEKLADGNASMASTVAAQANKVAPALQEASRHRVDDISDNVAKVSVTDNPFHDARMFAHMVAIGSVIRVPE